MQPLVSIIIPVYNGSDFLRQAVNSALGQTYTNIEVIIVNDGSNDNGKTEEVALSYGKRVRYLCKENGGVASALNFGISQMKGEYFSWLSHDDMYTPDKIEVELGLIEDKENAIACCNVSLVDESGKLIRNNYMNQRKTRSIRCFMALDTDTGINGCALLIPKTAFELCGYFREELRCTQDYDMWVRLSEKYRFVFSEKQMVLSRQHPAQDSKTKAKICTQEADKLHSNILRDISLEEFSTFESDLNYYKNEYKVYFNAKNKKTAAQILTKLLKLYQQKNWQYSYRNLFQNEVLQLDEDSKVDYTISQIEAAKWDARPVLLFYSNVWTRGGIERVLSIIMPLLTEKYNIILISNDVGEENSFELPKTILHIKIGSGLNERLPFSLLVLSILLKVDLFIGNPNIILSFLDVYEMLEESGIRTILCNHQNYFLPCWNEYLYPLMEKRHQVYSKVSAVTWLTSFAQYLGKGISSNGYLLPNPNTYEKCIELEKDNTTKYILCVGRFYDSIKRLDRALKVFRKVLEYQNDVKLILVGRYNLEMKIPADSISIKELIQELEFPNDESIIWVGETVEVDKYYKKAALQLVVSDNEGFGMVINEGAVYGCPSLIFEIPGLEDIITDGENGYVLPQDDIDGMAKKICDLFQNQELLEAMQKKSMQYAERFSKERILYRWKKLIDIVLNSKTKLECEQRISEESVLSSEREMELFDSAVKSYQKEIENVKKDIIKKYDMDFIKGRDKLFELEDWPRTLEGDTHEAVLKKYEEALIGLMNMATAEPDTRLKYILEQLPLNQEGRLVGIYGTGVHTKKMLETYERLIGKVKSKLVFIDTKKTSLTETYMGRDIYNVKDIFKLPLNDIVLSSNLYEDEMYETLKRLYGEKYKIYRFYKKSKVRLFN